MLRNGSDNLGWAYTGRDRVNRGRYGHGCDRAALTDFFSFEKFHGLELMHLISGEPCRAPTNPELPFTDIQV